MKPLALLLASAALYAQTPAPAPSGAALDKAAIEAYLRHMELWVPQVTVAIGDPTPSPYLPGFSELPVNLSFNQQTKAERYLVSADGKYIIKGDAYQVGKNPFQANLDRLNTEGAPSFGAAGAPVSLVVFGDFQCPYCKAEAESLRANALQAFPGKVRVVFKDFPLEAIHPWAKSASIAGRCVYRQGNDAFWNFHDWIYRVQADLTLENLNERILAWAAEGGADPVRLGGCIDAKGTDVEVRASMQEGLAVGVSSTPTTFLNGRKLEGALQWPVLQQLIAMEIEYQGKTNPSAQGSN